MLKSMRNDYYSDVYKVKDLFSDLQKSKAGNCLMVKKGLSNNQS